MEAGGSGAHKRLVHKKVVPVSLKEVRTSEESQSGGKVDSFHVGFGSLGYTWNT